MAYYTWGRNTLVGVLYLGAYYTHIITVHFVFVLFFQDNCQTRYKVTTNVAAQIAGIRWANVSIWRWPNVGYPRWANVILLIGPTLAQLVGITLGQRGFVLYFRWANVVVTRVCCIFIGPTLDQRGSVDSVLHFRWANMIVFSLA